MKLLKTPAAWKVQDLLNSPYWNYSFTQEEIAEIETAINIYKFPTIGNKFEIKIKLEPGDWLIVNNHIVYHARFTWEIESGQYDRLLLRIWLSPSNNRQLPDTTTFKTMWGNVEAGKPRGGFLPNHYQTPPDQPITQPLSVTESYWLDKFMKGRWKGIHNINNEQLT